MNIAKSAQISTKAILDKANPKGIHIGEYSYITAGVYILVHDMCRTKSANTYMGENVFIGVNSVIMCGVKI